MGLKHETNLTTIVLKTKAPKSKHNSSAVLLLDLLFDKYWSDIYFYAMRLFYSHKHRFNLRVHLWAEDCVIRLLQEWPYRNRTELPMDDATSQLVPRCCRFKIPRFGEQNVNIYIFKSLCRHQSFQQKSPEGYSCCAVSINSVSLVYPKATASCQRNLWVLLLSTGVNHFLCLAKPFLSPLFGNDSSFFRAIFEPAPSWTNVSRSF